MITVVIPVGPNKVYRKYLQEALDSLKMQSIPPKEVLLIDDMAGVRSWKLDFGNLPVKVHENIWLCGCAHSFNFGVALAKCELVLMLGSDDRLYPWAIEDCVKAYRKHQDPLGYYYCDVEYSDGETQGCACNCAMVTKTLWRHCGGFPIQSSVGANDSILISILLGQKGLAGHLIHVDSDKPPFWYRRHQDSVTGQSGDLQNAIFNVRDVLTRNWRKPAWTELRNS